MKRIAGSLAGLLLAAMVAAQNASPGVPGTFGTTRVTYISVPPSAFLPHTSDATYASDAGYGARRATGLPRGFVAPVYLPAGAKVVSLRLSFFDDSAVETVYAALVDCNFVAQDCDLYPSAGGGPADCGLPGFVCSGVAAMPGSGTVSVDLTGDDITVDNFQRTYAVYAEPTASSQSEKIAGAVVGYVLQVSPAPAVPTFNDVPAGDFGYQYIEALAFSGITGGCQAAPPLFCPDSFVTRRQMAIFLAKALGLQWPYLIF